MLVLLRFRVAEDEMLVFQSQAHAALDTLAQQRGYAEGFLGHNVDDPALWTVTTRWTDVGSYRRALSSHEVKVAAVPLLSRAVDEPSGFEVTHGQQPISVGLDPGAAR
ncbi:MAG: antibiotic biosynthesis monooxygenase family protein [Nocardioidaceae bacterium]